MYLDVDKNGINYNVPSIFVTINAREENESTDGTIARLSLNKRFLLSFYHIYPENIQSDNFKKIV